MIMLQEYKLGTPLTIIINYVDSKDKKSKEKIIFQSFYLYEYLINETGMLVINKEKKIVWLKR